MTNREESEEEMDREEKEFKVIVRINEEKGLQSINPVKLSTILKNQSGISLLQKF